MEKIAAQDAAFFTAEKPEMPQHVGGVMIMRVPPGASSDWSRQLSEWMRGFPVNKPPFNQSMVQEPKSRLRPMAKRPPTWKTFAPDEIDPSAHIKLWAVPRPGGMRELADLVAGLHETMLDRTKPLWEYHVIDGLEGGRTAVYMKIHHSLMDGMTGLGMWDFPDNPDELDRPPMWHSTSRIQARTKKKAAFPFFEQIDRYQNMIGPAKAAPGLAKYLKELATAAIKGEPEGVFGPFMAPRTMLNKPITKRRSIAMASLPFARCRAVAKGSGATLNDVFIALCGGALRGYLSERDDLPADAPLVAGVPVAVERTGDARNAATLMFASLATHLDDPRQRLEAVRKSTAAGKQKLRDMKPEVLQLFSATLMAGIPLMNVGAGLLEGSSRQIVSVAVSSMPGPKKSYMRGAEIERVYSTSVLTAGAALNITILSYADTVDFGLVACPDAVPDVDEIARRIEAELELLEAAILANTQAAVARPEGQGAPSRAPAADVTASSPPVRRGPGRPRKKTPVPPPPSDPSSLTPTRKQRSTRGPSGRAKRSQ